jgi:hypothetical protein
VSTQSRRLGLPLDVVFDEHAARLRVIATTATMPIASRFIWCSLSCREGTKESIFAPVT